jgi:hypothetical protein
MSKFNKITVVSVTGKGDGHNAVLAIKKSMAELPGSRGLLIAESKPSNLTDDIEFVTTEPFDYYQYSVFIMHCLYRFIKTEFALIVQDDGWILNGKNWDDDWFNYDYTGGICHAARVEHEIHFFYTWVNNPKAVPLMNGGLSLRSHKFLEAPSKYGIVYKHYQNEPMVNEDIQLGIVFRDVLERHGLVFCPVEKALYFSFEYLGPKIHDNLNFHKMLGHHAPTRRLQDNNNIFYSRYTQKEALNIYREIEVIKLLESYGYKITYKGEPPNGTPGAT